MRSRRFHATVLLLLVSIIAIPSSALAHSGSQSRMKSYMAKQCRYNSLDSRAWTSHEVLHTINCATNKWSVPGGAKYARTIAWRESRYNARAWNPYSKACGVFQHLIRYWPGRQNAFDGPKWNLAESCKNGRANVIVTIRMVHRIGNWSHWSTG